MTFVSPIKQIVTLIIVEIGLAGSGLMENSLPAREGNAASGHLYSTWDGYQEVDRCATAWLIKRHIDKDARFKVYPHGAMEMAGCLFDVPLAESVRTPNQTIFFSFLTKHGIDDPILLKIDAIVRDLELNTWAPKVTPEAPGLDCITRGLNQLFTDKEECLEKSFLIFDALYAALSRNE